MTKKTASHPRKRKTRIGILGCGAIGTALAEAIDRGMVRQGRLSGVSDAAGERAGRLSGRLRRRVPVLTFDELMVRSDLVVETANPSVVPALLRRAVQKRKDLLILSTGGTVGQERLLNAARRRGCRISFPSGALFGIDGVKAVGLSAAKIILNTRKPPRSFEGAPFVLRHRIRLGAIRRKRLLFRGGVRAAVEAFPQNINVAQTLVLAGVDPRCLEVRITADPSTTRNHHELILEGAFGRLTARTENKISPANPRTSRLAILSALAALNALFDPVRVGT